MGLSALLAGCASSGPDHRANYAALPAEKFPLPAGIAAGQAYTVTGRDQFFFGANGAPAELRDFYVKQLASAGYIVKGSREQPNGFAVDFQQGEKVGLVLILAAAPSRIDPDLGLNGSYVNVIYGQTPPPAPALPSS